MTLTRNIKERLDVAWYNIITHDLDVPKETMDALDDLRKTYNRLIQIEDAKELKRKKKEYRVEDADISEEEMAGYKKKLEKTYAVLNSSIGNYTIKDLTAWELCNRNFDLRRLDDDLKSYCREQDISYSVDDKPITSIQGRFEQSKKENGEQWKRISKAYRVMEERLAGIAENPDLSEENKAEINNWKNTFHELSAAEDVNPDTLKRVSAQGKLDAFFKRSAGNGKTILDLMQEKSGDDRAKQKDFDKALRDIKDFHKINIDNKEITYSAIDCIDSINARKNFVKVENGNVKYDTHGLALIIATRQLANAVKGNADNLKKTQLSTRSILERADELRNEPVYQEFIKSLEADENAMKKAINAACSGHGGNLEKQFKEFLQKQPAGMMPNKPIFARYMPTVKERIKYLQNQMAQGGDSVKTMAEIITLRNLAHVNKNNTKALRNTVPVDERNTLQGSVQCMSENLKFKTVAAKQEIKDLIVMGHGGEAMRTQQRLLLEEAGFDYKYPILVDEFGDLPIQGRHIQLMQLGTIEGRMDVVRLKADRLKDKIKNAENAFLPEKEKEVKNEFKQIMKEYLVLDNMLNENIPPYMGKDLNFLEKGNIKDAHMLNGRKDIDWNKYNGLMKDNRKTYTLKLLNKDFTVKEIKECMDKMAHEKSYDFMQSMARKHPDIVKPDAAQKNTKKKTNNNSL